MKIDDARGACTMTSSGEKQATGEKQRFEDGLKELEATVERLESGVLSLEDSLAAFERGISLVRELSGTLCEVEQRVEVLLREDGGSSLQVRELLADDES